MANKKEVKFGFSQLSSKTPDFGHWIPQLYVLLSVSGMGMMTALGIPGAVEQKIAGICLAFSPLFILIGQMFGINLTETTADPNGAGGATTAKAVPADDGGSTGVGGSNPPPGGLPDHP